MKTVPNEKVDFFIANANKWKAEYEYLRVLIYQLNLKEEFKWRNPCYTLDGANVVLIQGFKNYCALLFIQGGLLKDENNILIRQSENVQSARQLRFESLEEIKAQEDIIVSYLKEAIENQKKGLKVELKKKEELVLIPELLEQFKQKPELQLAFEQLTPGRQRAYNLFFSSAKQSSTRISRIEKNISKILAGRGLND